MKFTSLMLVSFALLFFAACNSGGKADGDKKAKQFPAIGTAIDSASMPVTGDSLNHFAFSIKITADSEITSGVYDVQASYGPAVNQSSFTMPKGGEDLKPVIKKGSAPNTFIIGFYVAGDTTFYDYFEVSSDKKAMRMQYIKSYSF